MQQLHRAILLFAAVGPITSHAMGQEAAAPIVRAFDEEAVGQPPRDFRLVESRDASAGRWGVQKDGPDTALMHTGAASSPANGLALALLSGPELRQLAMSVRLKLRGREPAGGLVWRYQDPNNYYFVQLRLDGQSLGLYRMANGNRVLVEEEDDLELDHTAWHTIRIRQSDESVRVYLGGVRVFESRDRALRGSGAVGVWARGGTTALFDDLRVDQRNTRRGDY